LGRSTSEDFSKADGVTGYLIKNATWKAFSKTEGELSVLAGTRRYVYRTGDAAPRAEYVPTPEARSAFDGLFGAINSKPLDWMRGPDVAIAGVGGAAGTSMILLNRVGTFTQAEARILATAALFTGGVFGYWLGNKDIGNIESGPFNDRLASDTKLWRGLDARYQALCTAFKISEVMLRTWELTNSKENEDLKSKTPLDAEFTRQVLSMTKWREKVPVEFQLGCIQS
jgi:hypothetical protein